MVYKGLDTTGVRCRQSQMLAVYCHYMFFAANWDGIYDNETGILMYTWAVGTTPCGDDIVHHNDPHEHLASSSEWTNIGIAFPLRLTGK